MKYDGEIEFEDPPKGKKLSIMLDGPLNNTLIPMKEENCLFSHKTSAHLPDGRIYDGVAYYGVSKWEPDVFWFSHFLPHRKDE